MPKTITVKGMGSVTTAPDYIVISMNLEAHEMDYEDTMEQAAKKIEQLNASLEKIGFAKKSVKTTNFQVYTDYTREKDKKGNYQNVFNGYICSHHLKVEFDFDAKRLAQTLNAIATCVAEPEFSIAFTVKDPSAVNKELLRSATVNAKEKAQILCEAAGVALGELLSIDYNWGEINVISHTKYKCECDMPMAAPNFDFEPDDIDVSDTAVFVWEIK